MKRMAAMLAAVCLLCLVGCSGQENISEMNLKQVSGLVSEKGYDEDDFKEKLAGQSREDMIDLWGEPDGMLSGFWGDTWNLADDTNQQIILYYDRDGIVEDVRLGERYSPDAAGIPPFSYEETLQVWQKSDPGVKTDGFQNTSEVVVSTSQQAIERAENECTIEYSATAVAYDSEAGIWRVTFFTEDSVGNSQEVYLDGTGMTTLIIYGE